MVPASAAGLVVGNAVTDTRGSTPGSSDTTLLADAAGVLRLNGHKFYSTGTLYADVIAVSARRRRRATTCRRSSRPTATVSNCSTTGTVSASAPPPSGSSRFTDVAVDADEVTTVSSGRFLGHGTAFLQLYLAAVTAGIAAAVRADAVDYVRQRARPRRIRWPSAPARTRSSCVRWGRSPPSAAAAETLVLSAADALDDPGGQRPPDSTRARWRDTAAVVAQAQLLTERLTIAAAERLFDTGGASATARALNLDRHWRNARTIASHSPLDYKAHAVGRLPRQRHGAAGQRLLLTEDTPRFVYTPHARG